MLGYCVWKYRAKPGDESDGEPIHGNTRLEIAWTVIPTVIVLFGAVYSWIVLGDIESKAPNALPIDVTAQQYKWTFDYPRRNGKVVSSERAERARRPPARPAPDRARRPPLLLGPRVADQARPGPRGPGRQRHRQHGRGHARPASAPTTSSARSSAASGTRRCAPWCRSSPDEFDEPGSPSSPSSEARPRRPEPDPRTGHHRSEFNNGSPPDGPGDWIAFRREVGLGSGTEETGLGRGRARAR